MTASNSKVHKFYTIIAVDKSFEFATFGKTPPPNVIPRDINSCEGLLSTLKLAQETSRYAKEKYICFRWACKRSNGYCKKINGLFFGESKLKKR